MIRLVQRSNQFKMPLNLNRFLRIYSSNNSNFFINEDVIRRINLKQKFNKLKQLNKSANDPKKLGAELNTDLKIELNDNLNNETIYELNKFSSESINKLNDELTDKFVFDAENHSIDEKIINKYNSKINFFVDNLNQIEVDELNFKNLEKWLKNLRSLTDGMLRDEYLINKILTKVRDEKKENVLINISKGIKERIDDTLEKYGERLETRARKGSKLDKLRSIEFHINKLISVLKSSNKILMENVSEIEMKFLSDNKLNNEKTNEIKDVDLVKRIFNKLNRLNNEEELNSQVDLNEDNELINQQQNETHLNELDNSNKYLNNFLKRLMQCKNISKVLDEIESEVTNLNPNELNLVYKEINFLAAKRKADVFLNNSFVEFKQIAHTSKTFNLLLDRTAELVHELNLDCLLSAFNTFNLIDLDPSKEIVKIILKKLDEKSDELNLNQIGFLVRGLIGYSKNPFFEINLDLKNSLENRSFKMIMNDQFDMQDFQTIIKFLGIFSSNLNLEAVDHLAKVLLSSKIELDFKQSINVLRSIKIATEDKQNRRFIKIKAGWTETVSELIDKCNLIILKNLTNDLSADNIIYYLNKIHRLRDSNVLNNFVSNFYKADIVDLISPNLISICNQEPLMRFQALNLIFNLSKFRIYNERLLKFAYEEVLSDEKLRSKLGLNYLFKIFYEIRFEFVDFQNLTQLLFDTAIKTDELVKDKYSNANLKYLTEFILFDIQDKNIIDYFDRATNDLDIKAFELLSDDDYKHICLAKNYLALSSELDEELKTRLINKFEHIYINILNLKDVPKIYTSFLIHNTKLQGNGYLSNGIYIDEFAIYDHSFQNLIPLIEFEEYFNRVDQIKLDPNQELLTFVHATNIKGNCKKYENNYNLKLKKILRDLNFKIIDVNDEKLLNLDLSDRISYLVAYALDSFK